MICKVLEDNDSTGDPCVTGGSDACFLAMRLCRAGGHYGTPECHYGFFHGYLCDQSTAPLCYDTTKSCFSGLTTPTPFFCAIPCRISADCPDDLQCISDENLTQTSTSLPAGIRYCGPPRCPAGTRDSYCWGPIPVLPGGPACPSGTTYQPAPSMEDCVCDPLSSNPDCNPRTCTLDADCGASMETCVGQVCTRVPCIADGDCNLGQICGVLGKSGRGAQAPAQRFCMSPGGSALGGPCAEGGDCASGQCYAGACVAQCRTNADCGGADECLVGPIVPGDPPFCSSRARCGNCAAGQYCDPWRQCQRP
ncbi:MAG: hypothetical protein U1E65_07410 [Myxococcota bacterium]